MFARIFEIIIAFVESFYFMTTVMEFERAVLLRRGRYRRTLEPGWRFFIPFGVDEILKVNVVRETAELPAQAFTTIDGVCAVATAIITFRISDVKKHLLETEDAEEVLADASRGPILRILRMKKWQDLVKAEDLDDEITKAVRRPAFRWGVEVEAVTLSDLTRARTLRLLVDGALEIGGGIEDD